MNIKPGWATVLMATYNRAFFLERSIGSCFAQEHPKVEVIVVDDASEDETPAVLERLQKKWGCERLKIFRNSTNLGVCASLNSVLNERSGEYFQFLDSDDYLHPQKIAKQVEALLVNGAEAAVCGFRFVEHATGQILRVDDNKEDIKVRLASFRGINNATPLIRSALFPAGLCFDPRFRFYTDRDFFFRYFLTVQKWIYCAGIWVDYLQHEKMVTRQRDEKDIPFETHWDSVIRYRNSCREAIPSANEWMAGEFAFSLAKNAAKRRRFSSARKLFAASASEKGQWMRKLRCAFLYLKSFFQELAAAIRGKGIFQALSGSRPQGKLQEVP